MSDDSIQETGPAPGLADSQGFRFASDDAFARVAAYRIALLRFQQTCDAPVERFGVSVRQYQALLLLQAQGEGPGLPMGELGKALQIQPATVTGMIERMEAKDHVERVFDRDNRRLVRVRLRPEGQALLARIVLDDAAHLGAMQEQARELADWRE